MYVFGYGSLMHPPSIDETLAYDVARFPLTPAYLHGFVRGFSAITTNRYGFTTADDTMPDLVAYMNVTPDRNARALGVLLTVDEHQLQKIEQRESMYRRHDVTQQISFPAGVDFQLAEGATVVTFVCLHDFAAEDYAGRVALGADYESIIKTAHQRIDSELQTAEFSNDFQQLMRRYANYPRLITSNSRSIHGYR